MKNQSAMKLEKDLLMLHTKYFTDTDKLTILHLVLDGKIADAKDMLKPQGVPEKEIDNIYFSVSVTTRQKREGEKEGIDYHFVSKKEFEKDIKDGFFLEGTGSMVLDRINKIVFACKSSRTSINALEVFCKKLKFIS